MKQTKKGSTVVLPSDFQSETTSNPLFKGDSRHLSHGCARADARTLAPEDINILIACEESQAECKAFRRLGFNAYSCDIVKCSGKRPEWHIMQDATPLLLGGREFSTQDGKSHSVTHWDLIIAHPPCTYLCKVSSVHLVKYLSVNEIYDTGLPCGWFLDVDDVTEDQELDKRGFKIINIKRYEKMQQARIFFLRCLNAWARFVAVENPIPMRMAKLPPPSTFIDPSWFGVKYTKKTLYWLRNLPPIMPTIEHASPKEFVRCSRGKYRSRTFPQVADALAKQWGDFILAELNNSIIG